MGQIRLFNLMITIKYLFVVVLLKVVLLGGYTKQDFICPLTGKSFKKRPERDYMKTLIFNLVK